MTVGQDWWNVFFLKILTGLSDPIACITGTNEKTYFQLILLFLIS
jgi:hypothetical protein